MKSKKRSYDAADKGRRSKSFKMARSTGANREIQAALTTLRDRSRHMGRNNGWAKRAVEAIVKHTVGEGIRPAPLGDKILNKRIKDIWKQWAESTHCDFYEKTNFYGLQELIMRTIVEGGDAIVILRHKEVEVGQIPIQLQVCEGDLLDHTKNGVNDLGLVRMGVQYSKEGRLLGYWIYDYHPGDGIAFGISTESKYYSKANILHVFEVLRPGQARGLPFGVASFMKQGDFGDYEDAQLFKQKIAACFAAFVIGADGKTDTEPIDILEPGIIEYLNSGDSVEFANPPTVGDYDSYALRILQGIAAAYGITYEMLTMDYSRVNFTSGRMAKIDVTQNFKSWQYFMLVPQLCTPVWNWFIDACIISGLLENRIIADWTAPRVQQLDPVKETDAIIKQLQSGQTTLSEVIRESGREPEEFFEEYKSDIELLEKFNIQLTSIPQTQQNQINNNIKNANVE